MVNFTENMETDVTGNTLSKVMKGMLTELTTGITTGGSSNIEVEDIADLENNTTFMSSLTLQQLTDEEFYRRLAPVIYLSILMVIGIPGNLLVLVVYFRDFTRSTHRTFILVLAALDLSVSAIALPFEITEMRYQYMFYAVTVCKIFRANNIFLTCGSMFIILSMSIERYKRVCHPLKPPMTTRRCRIHCLSIIVFSVLLSSANFVTSGTRHVKLDNNLTGSDCSLDDSYVNSDLPLVLDTSMFLLAMGTFTILLVLYSLIAKQIYKQNKFRRKFAIPMQTSSKQCSSQDKVKEHADNNSLPNIKTIEVQERRTGPLSTQTLNKSTTKVTKIAFTISLVFILSYLPYLLLSIATSLKRGFIAEPGPIASALLPIVTRSIFINNVANPFIYGFLDPKFRQSCKKRIKLVFRCCH